MKTYRAAYWTDGEKELVLTHPMEAELPEAELLSVARAMAEIDELDLDSGEIVLGQWPMAEWGTVVSTTYDAPISVPRVKKGG